MVLIEDKPISGLRSEIIDRIKDIFRIQAVDRLQRVNNIQYKILSSSAMGGTAKRPFAPHPHALHYIVIGA